MKNYPSNKILLAVLLTLFHGAVDASDFSRYQILIATKNNHTAILIPSFHGNNILERRREFETSLIAIIKKSNGNVCFENDPKEIADKFSISDSSYRSTLFNEKFAAKKYFSENNDTVSRLIKKLNLSKEVADRYLQLGTPIDLQLRVLTEVLLPFPRSQQSSIDHIIASSATMLGYKANYLESVDHVSILMHSALEDKELWQVALTKLSTFSDCDACIKRYVDLLTKFEISLFDGKMGESLKMYAKAVKITGEDVLVLDALVSKRNQYLAERIGEYLNTDQCKVFAIGAAHFGGNNALQDELASHGFDVKFEAIGGR